ncbi:hypothetical protein KIN20_007673 [Parelaphostrongylus tenuis]|uniref:Uncharacterized protein n=1 Tax=Parelaphostrongylus tenuis TaxID=148309 RepID=A0AAD5MMJ3_PARTN|nr:hypothetical protein KIN20_007673 [Parelaphostrongylus tenuis]
MTKGGEKNSYGLKRTGRQCSGCRLFASLPMWPRILIGVVSEKGEKASWTTDMQQEIEFLSGGQEQFHQGRGTDLVLNKGEEEKPECSEQKRT